jgi:4-oxalomesaconate tautomerase
MLLRGGTSKGAYFLAEDVPSSPAERDELMLRLLGSPDPRQIDGIGGAHPLTSKVAIVSRSEHPDADVDYLFLQVGVEEATVSDRQNCGNLLAGVGQFAVERGIVPATGERTSVRIRMVNSDGFATATFPTPGGFVGYAGDCAISGVPFTAAATLLDFSGTEGSATGKLLPTGNVRDRIDGIEVTCVDNGMPVVVAEATDLGITGYEPHEELAEDTELRERVQSLRLRAAELMGLGDVRESSIPKTTLVAAPRDGGTICTRTFIPLKPHTSIGVLGAVSVGTALMLDGGVGAKLAAPPESGRSPNSGRSPESERSPESGRRIDVEHPTGHLAVEVELDTGSTPPAVRRAGVVRTARKLFDGIAFPRV